MIFLCKENFNMRVFYYLSTCQTCKRFIKDLDFNDSIQKIDIKKTPINKDQLNYLYKIEGCYENLINKRAKLFKTPGLRNKVLEENDYKKLLLEHYTFLKRPVLAYDNNLFIGNSSNVIIKMKKFLSEH
tara:strand:- start:5235 stop:5621 length:387 start_codon:yes stop_codon:yes gene_type:complete